MKKIIYRLLFTICFVYFIFPPVGYTMTVITDQEGSKVVKNTNNASVLAVAPIIQSSGTFANIIVDGNVSDWNDIPVLINYPAGDETVCLDIINIKIANDNNFIYILQEFASPVLMFSDLYSVLVLDTDQNSATGSTFWGLGIEYGIAFLIITS